MQLTGAHTSHEQQSHNICQKTCSIDWHTTHYNRKTNTGSTCHAGHIVMSHTEHDYKILEEENKKLKEKAEKYDACGNLINQVNQLLQENKNLTVGRNIILQENHQFKDELILVYRGKNDYREKLEKIKIAWHTRVFSDEGDDFDKNLKEILESK